MCYDAKFLTKKVEKYADRYGILQKDIDPLIVKLGRVYHASAFAHPLVPVITGDSLNQFQMFSWGLVPEWVRSWQDLVTIRNKTLNARSETVFDLPSFKDSIIKNRCIVVFDAFYEHHHLANKTFPYHIELQNNEPISLAGIYSNWQGFNNKGEFIKLSTVSVLTTKANSVMQQIHNNPKLKESRMPVVLSKESEREWLKPIKGNDKEGIKELITTFPSELLKLKTVKSLRGKSAVGNLPQAEIEYRHPVIGLPYY